jgi:hypothetical protein
MTDWTQALQNLKMYVATTLWLSLSGMVWRFFSWLNESPPAARLPVGAVPMDTSYVWRVEDERVENTVSVEEFARTHNMQVDDVLAAIVEKRVSPPPTRYRHAGVVYFVSPSATIKR